MCARDADREGRRDGDFVDEEGARGVAGEIEINGGRCIPPRNFGEESRLSTAMPPTKTTTTTTTTGL